ncbi:hypothetical protein Nepgr_028295 [Nepenthes gracilis]|uniref:Uncharacterized protein n=1 Tax=Nepenthes gracilis TaxID=150966 RepID=A0AAD3TBP7_NEPGR|nr:hypothetical protein Nepgr_028295 [Nepenthes gracilis]
MHGQLTIARHDEWKEGTHSPYSGMADADQNHSHPKKSSSITKKHPFPITNMSTTREAWLALGPSESSRNPAMKEERAIEVKQAPGRTGEEPRGGRAMAGDAKEPWKPTTEA